MIWGAGMASASDRQLLRREIEAEAHHRHGLHRLARRPGVDGDLRVAGNEVDGAVGGEADDEARAFLDRIQAIVVSAAATSPPWLALPVSSEYFFASSAKFSPAFRRFRIDSVFDLISASFEGSSTLSRMCAASTVSS